MADDEKPVSYSKRFEDYMERLKDCVGKMEKLLVDGNALLEEGRALMEISPAAAFHSFGRDNEGLSRDIANLELIFSNLAHGVRLLGK